MKRFVMLLTASFLLMPFFPAHADLIFGPREGTVRPPKTKPNVPADAVVSPPEKTSDVPADTVASPPEKTPDEPTTSPSPATGRNGNEKRYQKP